MVEMDKATAWKLWDVTAARAGLLGKDENKWTDEDRERFDIQFEMMPGEFRAWMLHHWFVTDPDNLELAKTRRIDIEEAYRMYAVGSDYIAESIGLPESPLARTIPEAPGNTFALGIADKYITPG